MKQLYDYVVVLAEIGGTKVKAIRMDGFSSKYDRIFRDALAKKSKGYKPIMFKRLYPEDFEK